MAALLRGAAGGDVGAGGLVDGGGVERRVGALERVLAEAAAGLVEQPARRVDEHAPRRLLAAGGIAQRPRVAAPGQEVLLRPGERVAGVPQRPGLGRPGPDGLVDRPRGDGRLGQRLDGGRVLAAPVGAQRLGERVALGDEALEREPVEAVDVRVVRGHA